MALAEKTIIDLIEVLETNVIQIREATIIERDGVEISRTFNRSTATPGDDINNLADKVKIIAQTLWTPEVIAEYQEKYNKPVV